MCISFWFALQTAISSFTVVGVLTEPSLTRLRSVNGARAVIVAAGFRMLIA
jgi:hypothetical protein